MIPWRFLWVSVLLGTIALTQHIPEWMHRAWTEQSSSNTWMTNHTHYQTSAYLRLMHQSV